MLNNVIGVVLVGVAGRAPDEDHPYGHDKFETLGALGIVGFLSISCFELLREGVAALLDAAARRTTSTPTTSASSSATLVVNVFVVWYERRRGRAARQRVSAGRRRAHRQRHSRDAAGARVARARARRAGRGSTRRSAIAVALIIAWSGFEILRQSIPVLVDERAIDADELRRVVLGVPEIRDVRNVRSRSTASGQLFAEVTIAVPGATPVDDAHRLADAVEAAIEREFGTSQVTVHIEPA